MNRIIYKIIFLLLYLNLPVSLKHLISIANLIAKTDSSIEAGGGFHPLMPLRGGYSPHRRKGALRGPGGERGRVRSGLFQRRYILREALQGLAPDERLGGHPAAALRDGILDMGGGEAAPPEGRGKSGAPLARRAVAGGTLVAEDDRRLGAQRAAIDHDIPVPKKKDEESGCEYSESDSEYFAQKPTPGRMRPPRGGRAEGPEENPYRLSRFPVIRAGEETGGRPRPNTRRRSGPLPRAGTCRLQAPRGRPARARGSSRC